MITSPDLLYVRRYILPPSLMHLVCQLKSYDIHKQATRYLAELAKMKRDHIDT